MSTYGSTGPASPVRPPAPETNVLAVLGLIFAFLFPLLGLIFSVLALRQIGQQPARYTGRTLAVVGLLISIGLLLLGVIVGAFFLMFTGHETIGLELVKLVVIGGGGFVATKLEPFTSPYAPFGVSELKFKGQIVMDKPMDTGAYNTAFQKWEKDRAAALQKQGK